MQNSNNSNPRTNIEVVMRQFPDKFFALEWLRNMVDKYIAELITAYDDEDNFTYEKKYHNPYLEFSLLFMNTSGTELDNVCSIIDYCYDEETPYEALLNERVKLIYAISNTIIVRSWSMVNKSSVNTWKTFIDELVRAKVKKEEVEAFFTLIDRASIITDFVNGDSNLYNYEFDPSKYDYTREESYINDTEEKELRGLDGELQLLHNTGEPDLEKLANIIFRFTTKDLKFRAWEKVNAIFHNTHWMEISGFIKTIIETPNKTFEEDDKGLICDLEFFREEYTKDLKNQYLFKNLLISFADDINENEGEEWAILYLAYKYFANKLDKTRGESVCFFHDLEKLIPEYFTRVYKNEEPSDKRYRKYIEKFRKETNKWFDQNDKLYDISNISSSLYGNDKKNKFSYIIGKIHKARTRFKLLEKHI